MIAMCLMSVNVSVVGTFMQALVLLETIALRALFVGSVETVKTAPTLNTIRSRNLIAFLMTRQRVTLKFFLKYD